MSWSRAFEDPIPLPDGRELATLEQAAKYIQKLPKAEHDLPVWQDAVEALMMAAATRDGPTMMARIGVLRALNFGKPAPVVERKKRTKVWRILK